MLDRILHGPELSYSVRMKDMLDIKLDFAATDARGQQILDNNGKPIMIKASNVDELKQLKRQQHLLNENKHAFNIKSNRDGNKEKLFLKQMALKRILNAPEYHLGEVEKNLNDPDIKLRTDWQARNKEILQNQRIQFFGRHLPSNSNHVLTRSWVYTLVFKYYYLHPDEKYVRNSDIYNSNLIINRIVEEYINSERGEGDTLLEGKDIEEYAKLAMEALATNNPQNLGSDYVNLEADEPAITEADLTSFSKLRQAKLENQLGQIKTQALAAITAATTVKSDFVAEETKISQANMHLTSVKSSISSLKEKLTPLKDEIKIKRKQYKQAVENANKFFTNGRKNFISFATYNHLMDAWKLFKKSAHALINSENLGGENKLQPEVKKDKLAKARLVQEASQSIELSAKTITKLISDWELDLNKKNKELNGSICQLEKEILSAEESFKLNANNKIRSSLDSKARNESARDPLLEKINEIKDQKILIENSFAAKYSEELGTVETGSEYLKKLCQHLNQNLNQNLKLENNSSLADIMDVLQVTSVEEVLKLGSDKFWTPLENIKDKGFTAIVQLLKELIQLNINKFILTLNQPAKNSYERWQEHKQKNLSAIKQQQASLTVCSETISQLGNLGENFKNVQLSYESTVADKTKWKKEKENQGVYSLGESRFRLENEVRVANINKENILERKFASTLKTLKEAKEAITSLSPDYQLYDDSGSSLSLKLDTFSRYFEKIITSTNKNDNVSGIGVRVVSSNLNISDMTEEIHSSLLSPDPLRDSQGQSVFKANDPSILYLNGLQQ